MPDRIADPWGPRTPYARGSSWPVRVDGYLEPGVDEPEVDRWVQLSVSSWDPVSKQPIHKVAAVRVTRVAGGDERRPPGPGRRLVSRKSGGPGEPDPGEVR